MRKSTRAALWLVPPVIVFAVIVAAVDEPPLQQHRGKVSAVDRAAHDSAALAGQLEALPAVAAADTVTIVHPDPASRAIEVDTRQGPRRYRIDDATRLRTPTTSIALTELEPGNRGVVSARRDGEGFTATEIVVVALGSGPAPAREPEETP